MHHGTFDLLAKVPWKQTMDPYSLNFSREKGLKFTVVILQKVAHHRAAGAASEFLFFLVQAALATSQRRSSVLRRLERKNCHG